MPSLDDIIAQSTSQSFRRLNRAAAAPVSNARVKKPAATVPAAAVVAAAPDPEPQPDFRQALDRDPQAQGGRAATAAPRPHVHFHLHRVQLLDRDNKYASVKLVLDAIRYAGLIHDDTEQDIDLTVTQTRVANYAEQGTGVVISYY